MTNPRAAELLLGASLRMSRSGIGGSSRRFRRRNCHRVRAALDGAGCGLRRRREFRNSSGSDPAPAFVERSAMRLAEGDSRQFPNARISAVTRMRRIHVPVVRKAPPAISGDAACDMQVK